MADYQLNLKINGVDTAIASIEDLEKALSDTTTEMKTLQIGSDAFNTAANNSKVLKDELDKLKGVTDNLSFNQASKSFLKLGETVTGAFAIATNATALFGEKNEAVTAAAERAQQALAVVMGARAVVEGIVEGKAAARLVVEKLNNVAISLQTTLTTQNTVAKGANVAATDAQIVATEAATVAQEGLNVAMKANPIGLIIGAVALLATAFSALGESEEKTKTNIIDANEAIDQQRKIIDDEYKSIYKLTQLKGTLREIEAKTEEEKLKIRQETNIALGKITADQIAADANALEKKKKNLESELSFITMNASTIIERQKTLQDANIVQQQDARTRELIDLQNSLNLNLITREQYWKDVLAVQVKYSESEYLEQNKDKQKKYDALLAEIAANKSAKEQADIQAKIDAANGQAAINAQYAEAAKKRKDEFKKEQDDYINILKESAKKIDDIKKQNDELAQSIFFTKYSERSDRINQEYEDLKILKAKEAVDAMEKADKEIKDKEILKNTKIAIEKSYKDQIDALEVQRDLKQTELSNKKIDDQKKLYDELYNVESFYGGKSVDLYGDNILNLKEQATQMSAWTSDMAEQDNSKAFERESKRIQALANLEIIRIDNMKQNGEIRIKDAKDIIDKELSYKKISLDQEMAAEIQGIVDIKNARLSKLQEAHDNELISDKEFDDAKLQTELGFEDAKKIIQDRYREEKSQLEKSTEDEIFAYKVQKLQEFQTKSQEYAQIATAGLNLWSEIQKGKEQEATQTINEEYGNRENALRDQLNKGLITQKQYDAQEKKLNDDKRRAEYNAKKKAFDEEKKLKIAQAVIAGITGALQAFTGAMQLGPIAGPIVGGILAALVAATTAIQVANISKQKFDGGTPFIEPINDTGAGAVDAGSGAVQSAASTGGFTGFNPTLVGQPAGQGGTTQGGQNNGPIKVVVVESDITNAQRRVSVSESNATF